MVNIKYYFVLSLIEIKVDEGHVCHIIMEENGIVFGLHKAQLL